MKYKFFLQGIIAIAIMTLSMKLYAQGVSMDQFTVFGSRIKNPVVIDVRTEQQNIYFNVNNRSFYNYVFKVKFGDFRNLSPRVFEKETILTPGTNRLFTFKIEDPNQPPILSYETSYYMARSNIGNEPFKPYLVPIGQNHRVEFRSVKESSSNRLYVNQFIMNIGDTVFNSRKGTLTALPDDYTEVDRIGQANSLEVRHDDGTIALYIGISPDSRMVKLGQTVYPGQPVGIMGNSKILTFEVFEIQEAGKLSIMNILYSGPDNQLVQASMLKGTIVKYPEDVIEKEMSKREVNKYKKNSLY
jgi:hypothetical protein